jgi:hypothetical protein
MKLPNYFDDRISRVSIFYYLSSQLCIITALWIKLLPDKELAMGIERFFTIKPSTVTHQPDQSRIEKNRETENSVPKETTDLLRCM